VAGALLEVGLAEIAPVPRAAAIDVTVQASSSFHSGRVAMIWLGVAMFPPPLGLSIFLFAAVVVQSEVDVIPSLALPKVVATHAGPLASTVILVLVVVQNDVLQLAAELLLGARAGLAMAALSPFELEVIRNAVKRRIPGEVGLAVDRVWSVMAKRGIRAHV